VFPKIRETPVGGRNRKRAEAAVGGQTLAQVAHSKVFPGNGGKHHRSTTGNVPPSIEGKRSQCLPVASPTGPFLASLSPPDPHERTRSKAPL